MLDEMSIGITSWPVINPFPELSENHLFYKLNEAKLKCLASVQFHRNPFADAYQLADERTDLENAIDCYENALFAIHAASETLSRVYLRDNR